MREVTLHRPLTQAARNLSAAFSAWSFLAPRRSPQTSTLPRLAPRRAGSRLHDRGLLRCPRRFLGGGGDGLVRGPARGAGRRHHGLGDRNRGAAGALPRGDDAAAPATRLYQAPRIVTDIHKILSAKRPMTLAGAPAGFLP